MAYQAVGRSWTRVLARVAVLGVSGCSLIYNPNNIPAIDGKPPIDTARPLDGRPDAEIIADANPADLALTDVEPASIAEGTGDGSSRPEVLVIHGSQIVSGATVTVTDGSGNGSAFDVLDAQLVVAADGHTIAVPVVAHVDPTLGAAATRTLVVTVTQPAGSGSASQTIMWSEDGLAELEGSGGTITLQGSATYSIVDIGSAATVALAGSGPVIVRTTSSLSIAVAVVASANTTTPGPGGNLGSGAGGAGTGLSGGGGGGGFGAKGSNGAGSSGGAGGPATGDVLISSYVTNSSSAGGASTSSAAAGAGGGTIELTAAGSVSLNTVVSGGGSGAAGGLGAGGGGGAGGAIVVRGAAVTFGALTVPGGAAGAAGVGGAGGAGGAGRIRIDVGTSGITPPANGHQGLSFDNSNSLVVTTSTPTITIDGTPGDSFDLHVLDSTGAPIGGTNLYPDNSFGMASQLVLKPVLPDAVAYRLCVTPPNGSLITAEGTNCIHVAFVPTTP
jgi:hypothetical protein